MKWLEERVVQIQAACKEIEESSLSSETKMVVLKVLKDELALLHTQSLRISNEKNFVDKGFSK